MFAKLGIYWLTGSVAVLSDALESIVNIITSGFALFAVWLSREPRDQEHPYGHGRVEYLAELVEGLAVGVAGIAVLVVAISSGASMEQVEGGWIGVGLTALVALLSIVGGTAIVRAGARNNSSSLGADGAHIRADGITTAGTFLSLALVHLTGWVWIDVVVAGGIGVWLCVSAYRLIRSSTSALMDEANPELLDQIGAFLQSVREPGWLAPHETRVHRLGGHIHVDMHMVFPRFWTLERAHDVSNLLECQLEEAWQEEADLMLHMEPCTPFSCHYCDLPDCPVRSEAQTLSPIWTGEYIASHFRHGSPQDPSTWGSGQEPELAEGAGTAGDEVGEQT